MKVKKKPSRKKRSAQPPTRRDPLIDEVRRIRAEVSREHGHDLAKLFHHLRKVESDYGGKVVHKRSKRSSA